MKVALIGATGFVGSQVLKELLNNNHEITAIARKTDKIEMSDKLQPINIDITNTKALTEALRGNQIVVCAYNAGWDNPNLYKDYLVGYESIQKATRAANIRRLFVVGNAGSLYDGGKQLVDTDEFPEKMREGAKASRDHFDLLRRETFLDWVYLSPATDMMTTAQERTGRFRVGRDEPVVKEGTSSISVQDLAMVIADEIENRKHSRQHFTVGY